MGNPFRAKIRIGMFLPVIPGPQVCDRPDSVFLQKTELLRGEQMKAAAAKQKKAAHFSSVSDRKPEGEPGTVAGTDKDTIYVNCGEGVLALKEVQYEGKKRMSVQAFLLGAKVGPGQKLTSER